MQNLPQRLTIERLFANPSLSGSSLREIHPAPDGRRVAYLKARPEDQFQFDLWEFNLEARVSRRLLDSGLAARGTAVSDVQQARNERERTAMFRGITRYSWSRDGSLLLVPLGDDIFLVDPDAPTAPEAIAVGDVLDPQISPQGRYLSYVRDQNLVIREIATGSERVLTTDGGGTVHNALAEFVAQEEMHQTSGYWWAPDDSAIAFKWFDEARVPVIPRLELHAGHAEVVRQRYPAAGDANVEVRLAVVTLAGGALDWIDLGADPDIYLVRADWGRDTDLLTYQRIARDQRTLELIAVDRRTAGQRVLVTERSSAWVNVGDRPVFLEHQDGFLWSSENSGHKHLYRYPLAGGPPVDLCEGPWGIDEVLAVDETAGRVYVSANRDALCERQVYALDLAEGAASPPTRITLADGWHEAEFARNAQLFVSTWSDPNHPPVVSVRDPGDRLIAWIEANPLDDTHPYAPYRGAHVPTEWGRLGARDGQELCYSLLRPLGFQAGRRYPVFLSVYGGPGVQIVTRQWGSLFEQFMAQEGYVVFRLDNRGSARRARRFTDVLDGVLGRHEVEDQLAGIEWLSQQDFVDSERIGVFGWSYGGFLALRLLCAASKQIAAGVAVAPVTDWALYDTFYTERFLKRPIDNPEGYRDSGVFAHLDGLTSDLLLVHGMADDNVLFTHSTRLIAALEERGILFQFMAYPGAKHGLSTPSNQVHVYRTIHAFFSAHVAGRDGTAGGPARVGESL
jgi:dipeptidyl-peptidase-4